jgi:hypothetical protein
MIVDIIKSDVMIEIENLMKIHHSVHLSRGVTTHNIKNAKAVY